MAAEHEKSSKPHGGSEIDLRDQVGALMWMWMEEDFRGNTVFDGNRGDEEVMDGFGVQDRNTEGQVEVGHVCSGEFLPEEART